jgi:hypothetical protein
MKTLLEGEDKGGPANAEAASEATATGVRGASDSEQVGSEAQKFCWCVHGERGAEYTHTLSLSLYALSLSLSLSLTHTHTHTHTHTRTHTRTHTHTQQSFEQKIGLL